VYKLILFMLMGVLFMTLTALQFDEEAAMQALFQAKHSVNYAVHAASQQVDGEKLARGIYSIDTPRARQTAEAYLQANLRLDSDNRPLPGSFLKTRVEILDFQVINENHTFPYTYKNPACDYEVTLQRPGVVMIIQVEYPRTYRILGPVLWKVKGASELVYS